MTTTLTLHTGAVDALAALLPASAPLESALWPMADGDVPAPGTTILAVDYLGSVSAEMALSLPSATEETIRRSGGSAAVAAADVLRPALEAAAGTLGSGVLGDVAQTASTTLFSDAESAVYRLFEPGSTETFAWFAIRIRQGQKRSSSGSAEVSVQKLARIHDVEMALSVVIGRTRMTVANVLGLEPGDVVDLDRSAGAPADVLLNGRLIAHGEVSVEDGHLRVLISEKIFRRG